VRRRASSVRPTELSQTFNFDLLEADWDVDQFRSIIDTNLAEIHNTGSSPTWVLSNHDVVRHASRYGLPAGQDYVSWLLSGGQEPHEDRAAGLRRAATLLVLALPGSTYLYQGEELGLFEVADLPRERLEDPVWEPSGHQRKGRDGCRVPLPWAPHGLSFGFAPDGAHLPQPSCLSRCRMPLGRPGAASASAGRPRGSWLSLAGHRSSLATR
jgi:alpha-glucosidase